MKNTAEQNTCVDLYAEKKPFKVEAVAGSGKTTTVRIMAESDMDRTALYLAFNKAAADEASDKMPCNTECRTTHSIAYRSIIGGNEEMRSKLSRPPWNPKQYVNAGGTVKEIANLCKVKDVPGASRLAVARVAKQAVSCFEASASKRVSEDHIPFAEVKKLEDKAEAMDTAFSKKQFCDAVVACARKLWDERVDRNSPVVMTHDTYLKLYQMSNPVLPYDVIFLDEAQDTSDCVIDIVMQQIERGTQVVCVGDTYQSIYCQPAGTMVTVVEGCHKSGRKLKQVDIKDLKVGMKVLSYDLDKAHLHKDGKPITKFGERIYKKDMYTLETATAFTKSTYDHHSIVRLGHSNDDKFVTYLMEREGKFRVGVCPWKGSQQFWGPSQRASVEKADKLWVLSVHETRDEALVQEALNSYKYGIPQVTFEAHKSEFSIKFWEGYKKSDKAQAGNLLATVGKKLKCPIWKRGQQNVWFKSAFVIETCNVLQGMEVAVCKELPETHGKIPLSFWEPITNVSWDHTEETVYSMEVADDHTYFADGILTHNCWRGAVNALAKIKTKSTPLSQSWRYGPEVASVATYILNGAMEVKGAPHLDTKVGQVDVSKPYTQLFRTNIKLIQQGVKLIRQGVKVRMDVDINGFVKMLTSMIALKYGDNRNVKHEDIIIHATWQDLLDEADVVKGELKLLSGLVDRGNAEDVLDILSDHKNANKPHVILTTAHKSKGMEYPQVILADDFMDVYDDEGDFVEPSDMERNLLYVASTRAIEVLQLNETVKQIIDYRKKGKRVSDNRADMANWELEQQLLIEEAFDREVSNVVSSLSNDMRL